MTGEEDASTEPRIDGRTDLVERLALSECGGGQARLLLAHGATFGHPNALETREQRVDIGILGAATPTSASPRGRRSKRRSPTAPTPGILSGLISGLTSRALLPYRRWCLM